MISRVSFSTLLLTLIIVGVSSTIGNKNQSRNHIYFILDFFCFKLYVLAEHDAGPAPAPAFTYWGTSGPGKWGSLCPEYSKCSTGKRQSPVNIEKDKVVYNKNFKPLTRHYRPANATLVNNGFNIGVCTSPFSIFYFNSF